MKQKYPGKILKYIVVLLFLTIYNNSLLAQPTYIKVSDSISMNEFEQMKNFILKHGVSRLHGSLYGSLPYYEFKTFDVMLFPPGGNRDLFRYRYYPNYNYMAITDRATGLSLGLMAVQNGDKDAGIYEVKEGMKENETYFTHAYTSDFLKLYFAETSDEEKEKLQKIPFEQIPHAKKISEIPKEYWDFIRAIRNTIKGDFIKVTDSISINEFEKIKKFILKCGDKSGREDFDSRYRDGMPHYNFGAFNAYLFSDSDTIQKFYNYNYIKVFLDSNIIQKKTSNSDNIDFNSIWIRDEATGYKYEILIVRNGDTKTGKVREGMQENEVYFVNVFSKTMMNRINKNRTKDHKDLFVDPAPIKAIQEIADEYWNFLKTIRSTMEKVGED